MSSVPLLTTSAGELGMDLKPKLLDKPTAAVMIASGKVDASSKLRSSGIGMVVAEGATLYSAYPPYYISKSYNSQIRVLSYYSQ